MTPQHEQGRGRKVYASEMTMSDEFYDSLASGSRDLVSPTNACIRAAKNVIRALNLPEGAGVQFTGDDWNAFDATSWWPLPPSAIPRWPGDSQERFITLNTPEVSE